MEGSNLDGKEALNNLTIYNPLKVGVMSKKEVTKNSIIYLVKQLGDKVEGRKKIMKLMFLLTHYDLNKGKPTKQSFLDNEFIIYHYGVFSFEVIDSFIELIKEKKLSDSFPMKLTKNIIPGKITTDS